MRLAIYSENVAKINAHNADSTQTYKMGINKFTDMTQEEFESRILMTTVVADWEVDTESKGVANVDWNAQGGV